jgi:hypothetical protein
MSEQWLRLICMAFSAVSAALVTHITDSSNIHESHCGLQLRFYCIATESLLCSSLKYMLIS